MMHVAKRVSLGVNDVYPASVAVRPVDLDACRRAVVSESSHGVIVPHQLAPDLVPRVLRPRRSCLGKSESVQLPRWATHSSMTSFSVRTATMLSTRIARARSVFDTTRSCPRFSMFLPMS